ncbi:MAG: hypothetical protein ABIQ74_13505 [Chitinophagales bacterium]
MIEFHFGDLFLAEFQFTSGKSSKLRPGMIILDSKDDDVLCATITSPCRDTVYNIQISKWKEAGLLQPSIIRCH